MLPLRVGEVMWIHSFNEGNEQAFKQVFERYYKPLCSYVYQYVSDVSATDDIVQELFVSLWSRKEHFESIEKIKSFLFVSARNACLNELTRLQLHQTKLNEYKTEREYEEFEDFILIEEFDRKLTRWLDALPRECRRIVELSLSGRKNQEIAEMLQISISTVKNQKVKGFKILRELYRRDYVLLFIIGSVLMK